MARTETSSLDADLRIRLEGAAEVLEEACARLDRARTRLEAGLSTLVRADVDELKVLLASWPRHDEALLQADRLDGAHALTASVRRAREALVNATGGALAALGRTPPAGGLAEHLRALVAALQHVGRPTGPHERALLEGRGASGWGGVVLLELLAVLVGTLGRPELGFLLGLTVLLVFLMARRPPTRWRLLPDRLQLERSGWPMLEVQYEDIVSVSSGVGEVVVKTRDLMLEIPALRSRSLEKLVRSMMEHMGGAQASPGPSVVLPVHHGDRPATALFMPEGVWLIDRIDARAAIDAVLPGHDTATLEEAVAALAHLPPALLARRLESVPGS